MTHRAGTDHRSLPAWDAHLGIGTPDRSGSERKVTVVTEKKVTRVYYPQGPDGPAEYDDMIFTTDHNVLSMYESEVERHVWLYLAEQRGEGVPDQPSAHAVTCSGLSRYPYRYSANIPAEAIGLIARIDEAEVEARVHSIRTARGRLLRRKGWSRITADQTGRELAAMRPSRGRNTGPLPSAVPLSRGEWQPLPRSRLILPEEVITS